MKRILFALFDLLTIAGLVGGYLVQYFTRRKMGMNRWVNYNESKVKEMLPVDILKYAAVLVVLILVILVVKGYWKKRAAMGKIDAVMTAVMVVLAVVYLGFTAIVTVEKVRAYYFVLPLLGFAALMQIARNAAALWMCRDEK